MAASSYSAYSITPLLQPAHHHAPVGAPVLPPANTPAPRVDALIEIPREYEVLGADWGLSEFTIAPEFVRDHWWSILRQAEFGGRLSHRVGMLHHLLAENLFGSPSENHLHRMPTAEHIQALLLTELFPQGGRWQATPVTEALVAFNLLEAGCRCGDSNEYFMSEITASGETIEQRIQSKQSRVLNPQGLFARLGQAGLRQDLFNFEIHRPALLEASQHASNWVHQVKLPSEAQPWFRQHVQHLVQQCPPNSMPYQEQGHCLLTSQILHTYRLSLLALAGTPPQLLRSHPALLNTLGEVHGLLSQHYDDNPTLAQAQGNLLSYHDQVAALIQNTPLGRSNLPLAALEPAATR